MKDFNNDGKVDKKDYQIFEDINSSQDMQGNTTAQTIIVMLIVIGIILLLKLT